MKRLVRNAIRGTLSVALRPVYSGIGCIFALHRVAEKSSEPRIGNVALEISPDNLGALIQHLLSHGYDIVTMDQVHEILTTGKRLKRFAAFTFDDGYLDNLTLGLPTFQKYKVPLAVYIPTSFIGNNNALWWYRLEHVLLRQNRISFSHAGQQHELNTASPSQKDAAFDYISSIVRKAAPAERVAFLEKFFAPETEFQKTNLVMNWDQVKELAKDKLVTMGAHSVNHFDFGKLSEDELRFEINESKSMVESMLGRKVEHFSYPFGGRTSLGEREFTLAKSCGLKTFVTTRMANIFPGHAQHLESLPRLIVGNNYPIIPRFTALETGVATMQQNGFKRVVTV